MSQAQNAGFAFWDRATLVQFASQATATLRAICEIADNNNPASVMHDDPRKALEQIEVLALGAQAQTPAQAPARPDKPWRLWMCAQETGQDFLHDSGDERPMRANLALLHKAGRDVWLIAPDGTKVLPEQTPA